MILDYHIHTKMCGHATGELEEYLDTAVRKELTEIGFADHLPLYFLTPENMLTGYAMTEAELPVYVDTVLRLRENSPVVVKLGVEADYVPGYEGELRKLLNAYPFDYVIGSVHFIDGWSFDNQEEIDGYSKWDIGDLYERYFALVRQAAMSGLFDIMAHPDLIKKFNYKPSKDLMPLYEETVTAFKKAGVCVEVNTAGLRCPVREIYPSSGFLSAAFRYGLPVTLGSDAHRPDITGAELSLALALIKSTGYTKVAVFEGRNRSFRTIS